MRFALPATYLELLNKAAGYAEVEMPKAEILLQNQVFNSISLHAQAPVFYAIDYVQKKYLFVDPSCRKILGCSADDLIAAGPEKYTTMWHPADFKLYNETIFPGILAFLREQPFDSLSDHSFSLNYRLAISSNTYVTVLQRSTFYVAAADRTPLAVVGFVIDISDYKSDTNVVFTIEKIDRTYHSLTKKPVFKAVYAPERCEGILSKRETEVLQCIYEGMSSKQIADKLFVSVNTVNNHRKNMLEKTNCGNTAELLRFSLQHNII